MTQTDRSLPLPEAMSQLITSWRISLIIRTMVVLGVPDQLAGGPRSVPELATTTGTHPPTLRRLLRAAAGIGLCATTEDGRIRLTEQGQLLRADVPSSMHSFALALTAPYLLDAWEHLPEAVRTGAAVFQRSHGCGFWDYLAAHPEEGARFNGAMRGSGGVRAQALLSAVNLDDVGTLADIGGGQGQLLATLLAATPGLRGILFDQPHVLAGAVDVLAAAGVADRCELVPGDFFRGIPPGADAYTLAYIIHDWPDAEAIEILRLCHRAMAPGARVWLIEQVIPEGDDPHPGKLMDLHMLVLFGGQDRTGEEYRALLEAAGFSQITVYPTPTPYSVAEAVRT